MKPSYRIIIIDENTDTIVVNHHFDDLSFEANRGHTVCYTPGKINPQELKPNGTFSLQLKATNLGGAINDEATI